MTTTMTVSEHRRFLPTIRFIFLVPALLGLITVFYTSQVLSLVTYLIPDFLEDTTIIDRPRILRKGGKSEQEQQLQQLKYVPLNCTPGMDGFRSSFQSLKNWNDPRNDSGQMEIAKTITNPSFLVSVNPKAYDSMRYAIKEKGKYYEAKLTAAFAEILQSNNTNSHKDEDEISSKRSRNNDNNNDINSHGNPKVIMDVGSNIGWFSLLSASLGQYHVYTFDASPTHLVRLCESLILNNWTGTTDHKTYSSIVNLYNYGVGQYDDTKLTFSIPVSNPGAGSIIGNVTPAKNTDRHFSIDMLSLDSFAQDKGWIPSSSELSYLRGDSESKNTIRLPVQKQKRQPPPTISILKIDVEGVEDKVIQGSKRLLQSGLVENIFMELQVGRKRDAQIELVTTLIESSYRLYKWGYWSGPEHKFDYGEKSNTTSSVHVDDIMNLLKKHDPNENKNGIPPTALNVWWKLKK